MASKEEFPSGPQSGEYTVEHALNLALKHHRDAEFSVAEEIYSQLLSQFPNHVDALNFFGVLRHQMGRTEEGANLIRRSLAIDPEYSDAWNNLGNLLLELDRFEEAAKAYRKVIRLNPENVNALSNLGLVTKLMRKYGKSEEYFRRALAIDPDHNEANRNLGNLLLFLERKDEAHTLFQRALEKNPEDAGSYRALARAYRLAGNTAAATIVYRQWLNMEPDSATAHHHLVALTGEGVPDRASAEYVCEEFDGFANSFDRVLQRLRYRAPMLCDEALRAEIPEADGSLDILDAGCGTGLCGGLLRPFARVLTGVDLSRKMVERARSRNQYDELVVADLLTYLPEAGPFDVVISADTLCYFGRLTAVLTGMASATQPGGIVIFTLEVGADDGPGFELQGHGRYRHSEGYVRESVGSAGFELRDLQRCVLRTEGGKKVGGFAVTARRP